MRLHLLALVFLLPACGGNFDAGAPLADAESRCVETEKGRRCYQIRDGYAITAGDVALGTAEELAAATAEAGTRGRESYFYLSATRWPNSTIPYAVKSGFTQAGLDGIQAAVAEYAQKTNVRFVPRTSQKDYVVFIPSTTGCWSYVGRIGGAQPLHLDPDGGCAAAHEMGHAIGFEHEHQRPDRDQYLDVRLGNVDPAELDQLTVVHDPTSAPFDVDSVMEYDSYAFSKNGEPVILRKGGGYIGYQYHLSAGDIAAVNAHYKPPVGKTGCTPKTCASLGKNCGSISDGCGGTLSCGGCGSSQTCGGGGVPNVCGGTTSCTYSCKTYGYSPNQCVSGWQCDSRGCLTYVGTCSSGGGSTCAYSCSKYGYAPNQCYQGWRCDSAGQCLSNVSSC